MPDQPKKSWLQNVLGFLGSTLTSAGTGVKKYSGAFTPVAGARGQSSSRSVQQAGSHSPDTYLNPRNVIVSPEQRMDTSLYPSPAPTAASIDEVGAPIRQPIKTDTDVTPQRVQQFLLSRFNPIRGLSPRLLSNYLEQYDLGFIRSMSLVWNKIKERDDQVSAVVVAREAKPADMGWEIVADDEDPEAVTHKQALEDFYNGVKVTHALDQNQWGGVSLLIRLMMKAVGDKFAPFEIVWRPEPDRLTAEMRYIPPWFFENRTGQLRFLPYELAMQGVPLEPGGWMVHVGEGLFAATSIAYLYKQMGLKTWVTYQEKFGIPFLQAKTNADYQSAEWNGLLAAIQNFASDGGLVTKMSTTIEAIAAGATGTMPHEPFCDRMDRAIARVWRGGDLSTMSKGGGASGGSSSGGGVGSLPQMENESALSKADAERISETCQFYLDRWIIRYRFGPDVEPKAKFMIQPPLQLDMQREILVDTFLLSAGVPLAMSDLYERYGRTQPDEGDTLAHAPAAPAGRGSSGDPSDGTDPTAMMGNIAPDRRGMRRFKVKAGEMQANALAKSFAPLRSRLLEIAKVDDPDQRRAQLQDVLKTLPSYVGKGVTPALIKTFEESLATAAVIGATDGAESTGFMHTRNGHHAHQ